MKVIKEALKVLRVRVFVVVATSDIKGKPNCAPKLLLKVVGRIAYLIDYSIGRTAENLTVNPEVSLSFFDINSLVGYRLNGNVEIIEKGKFYNECLGQLRKKEMKLTVERIVRGVRDGKLHKAFESEFPERFLVYKVKIEEGCEISSQGVIKQESG